MIKPLTTDHFHFYTQGPQKEGTPKTLNSDVMRQLRTVIRSMLTSEGSIVAMDDATIVWKPKIGRSKRARIEAPASVLLGLVGPNGRVDRVVAGDQYGGVSIINLFDMQVVDRYLVGNSKVRCLCVSSMSGESILVGCEDGSVHIIGDNVPNRVVGLFE